VTLCSLQQTSKESACRIICTGTPENGGIAGHFPLCPFKKGGNGGGGAFSSKLYEQTHFGGCDFLPACPQSCPKSHLCNFCLQFFSHKDHQDLFWCDLQNRPSYVFLQTLGAIFWSEATLDVIFTRIFRDFTQIFNKSKLLGVRLHPHLQHHCFS